MLVRYLFFLICLTSIVILHWFVSEEWMQRHRSSYIELNHYDSKGWYGSNGVRIDEARLDVDAVICLEINGATSIKKHYGADTVFIVYVHRDLEKIADALHHRVETGEMTQAQFEERLDKIVDEMDQRCSEQVDFEINNDGTPEDAVQQVLDFVANGYDCEPGNIYDKNHDLLFLTNNEGDDVFFLILEKIKYNDDDYQVVVDEQELDGDVELALLVLLVDLKRVEKYKKALSILENE